MKLATTAFADGGAIPAEFAFGRPDATTHVALSSNRNPDLAWSGAPSGTRSFAILCIDPDVPSRGDDVNREGRVVPASLPRVDFCHWVLIDLPGSLSAIARGEYSDGVTARGKPGPAAKHGARQGINDYTGWFAGDPAMAGDYHGYDGPCPPWNDAIVHHYAFTVFALSVDRLAVEGRFGLAEVRRAMGGHVLAEAKVTGRYSLNPAVRA
ncbi:MAG: YbhB/YbcL family Raf kinase inhibitor-like protein [Burkholderiales bacterium]|nr:YbhB/YbcL family Raf kinase inhibitor-like protein [Burkholderiales bacterium]MCE7878638.1 YbhB/YbcL family Raf kinase inhibitor-like protein [Betaproteobacteria bacterium PRO3]